MSTIEPDHEPTATDLLVEIAEMRGMCQATAALTPQPYDVYAKLEDPIGVLSVALGQWEDRDDTRAQPEVRRAANTAMDAIDQMTHTLYAMRSRLVTEIRASDDASAKRADAMLARGLPGASDARNRTAEDSAMDSSANPVRPGVYARLPVSAVTT